MIRKTLAILLLLLPAVPALAKSDPDFYPLSCDVLWTAVKSTLNNPNDYGVIAIDDLAQRASFVVVGDLTVFKDVVALKSQNKGCSIKLSIIQIGSDNSNERGFRGRLRLRVVGHWGRRRCVPRRCGPRRCGPRGRLLRAGRRGRVRAYGDGECESRCQANGNREREVTASHASGVAGAG